MFNQVSSAHEAIVPSIFLACAFVLAFPDVSQAQDAAAGKQAFDFCSACHVAEQDVVEFGRGPPLFGVIGRKAGGHPGYPRYSDAMIEARKRGVVWDEQTLTAFIRNPKDVVEGSDMMFGGLKNEAEVANLVAYLKQFSK